MKSKFNYVIVAALLSSSLLFSSCIGSFSLFNKLLAWNKTVSDKFVNELIFIVISPAYGIAMTADVLILNSIEFWTGSNPVASTDIKKIEGKDGIYTVETNKEGHKITKDETGETVYFKFDETEKTWSIESKGETTKLLKVVDDENVVMYLPNGSEMPVTLDQAGVLAFKQVVANDTYFAAK